jgi:uncharacterized protein YbcC (UPF0753/DUF2309 family)
MTLELGKKLSIRSMVYVAGEPIPFFWPMRSFIHHNPLHGLEGLFFHDAIRAGTKLFHGRGFLPRSDYKRYLDEGKVDSEKLESRLRSFAEKQIALPGIDLTRWLMTLLNEIDQPAAIDRSLADAVDVHAALHDAQSHRERLVDEDALATRLREELLGDRPVYEAVDLLYGTEIGSDLDELVIKTCLDFFDEGQSVWSMPGREQGFFTAWRDLAAHHDRLLLDGLPVGEILTENTSPEEVIAAVMNSLNIPHSEWVACFSREIAQLHGWAGFIRWRANAKRYHWTGRFPADLVDFLAIRLTLAQALLNARRPKGLPGTRIAIEEAIDRRTRETWLRYELYSARILPAWFRPVEQALMHARAGLVDDVFAEYSLAKRSHEAATQARRLRELASACGDEEALLALSVDQLDDLLGILRELERDEGMVWLEAMETHAMGHLLKHINLAPSEEGGKRPFAQALFCIDTRSERIRRHLEGAGNYETFGIAGFFGVPISFMQLGKGSETHLCPVLLKPKNLVLEIATAPATDIAAVSVMEKLFHELKESVLTPYVTVEAIGMLFGLDMIGKTIIPQGYARWRQRLYRDKPASHLLLDKLDREQADSIVRAVQRAVVGKAVEQEIRLKPEEITDDMVRELREAALGHAGSAPALREATSLTDEQEREFIQRVRNVYRIDPAFARLQMEQLGRIGFSLDEQTNYVTQALSSIGLKKEMSRFVLLVGHGSTSENNPYESALDCGACGGNHGLVNAKALAHMANKPQVRNRLRYQGITIPEDTWFIPAMHDTVSDEIRLYELERIPSSHVIYLDRLRSGLTAASRLCAQERLPELQLKPMPVDPGTANRDAHRNAVDWSQARPEWGLSGNAYFIIGRRNLTRDFPLKGRAFLHSYDYRVDPRRRLLESILTGPLVVGQWINMEHYFSTVDNERFGSGSKVYHNVAGRFGVMTGNLSDLRTGLPSQTVLKQGHPWHQPIRLVTVIEAPFDHAWRSIEEVATIKHLVRNGWIRLMIIDPEKRVVSIFDNDEWDSQPLSAYQNTTEREPIET